MNSYRPNPLQNLTPVVKNILIINVIFSLAIFIFSHSNVNLDAYLSAFYFNSPNFKLWQIITYSFVQVGFISLFFNLLAIFIFGPTLEAELGPERFLSFYFIVSTGALVIQWIVQALVVHRITGSYTVYKGDISAFANQPGFEELQYVYGYPIFSASSIIFGMLVAYGLLYPNRELFLFFIPLPVKAKYIIIGYVVFEIVTSAEALRGGSVVHVERLGGAIISFILIKIWRVRGSNNFFN